MAVRIVRTRICTIAARQAMEKVKAAVKRGDLVDLRKKVVKCADCEKRADVYDHRRYAEPLNVDPVCKRHNQVRGFALDQSFVDIITGESSTSQKYREERCRLVKTGDCLISAISGPMDHKSNYQVDRAISMRARRSAKKQKTLDYLNGTRLYHFSVGGIRSGESRMLSGMEALLLNKAAEMAFISAIQTDRRVRLSRWFVSNPEPRVRRQPKLAPVLSHARFSSK